MDDFEKELKLGFLDEATQSLADAEQSFLALEKSADDPSIIEKIFRFAHNLKGSSRAVGFNEIGEFTHQLESLLLKLKNKELPVKKSTVDLLLRCNDRLRASVEALQSDMGQRVDCSDLLAAIASVLAGKDEPATEAPAPAPTAAAASEPALDPELDFEALANAAYGTPVEEPAAKAAPSVEAELDPELDFEKLAMAAWGNASEEPAATPAAKTAAASAGASVADATSTPVVPASAAPAPSPSASPSASASASRDESIRVSLGRLEKLMNNVGELVILQTVLNEQRHGIESTLVQKTIVQLSKITKEIQSISMSLRMVPLRPTFQKMQRIVRDTSHALGKDIDLVITGEDTEIDKTLAESIGDPLVHLIRNACDHGVERAEDRVAKGKPARGRVELRAFHRGSQMVIEVRDDGAGINADKLREKAVEKGILSPAQAKALSDAEARQLIFASGFSTKTEVTDISGRGVGMDVVRTNIEKELQGKIEIDSEVGKGSCMRILLPLTLAIIDGMVVQAGNERFVFPIAQVQESLKPGAQDVHVFTGVGEMLNLRGESYPLHRLSSLMGVKSDDRRPAAESVAMMVRSGGKIHSILVDEIMGQQQVVIKKLGRELEETQGVSGGAIMGDGRVALILDVDGIFGKQAKAYGGAA